MLHLGQIAEMKTGEGKTLTSTLPIYLNGVVGKGVHVVTVNDYLARRDSEWMGRVYRARDPSLDRDVALKTIEGTVRLYSDFLRKAFKSSPASRFSYLLARRSLNKLRLQRSLGHNQALA